MSKIQKIKFQTLPSKPWEINPFGHFSAENISFKNEKKWRIQTLDIQPLSKVRSEHFSPENISFKIEKCEHNQS